MTNNTDGAALLPVTVTQADREAAADLIEQYWQGAGEQHDQMRKTAASYRAGHSQGVWAVAFARHRISHSLPGDVGMREAVTRSIATAIYGPGFDPFLSPESWDYCEMIATAALTPSPLPATQEDAERSGVEGVDDPYRIAKNALFAIEKQKAPAFSYGGVLTDGGKRAWISYSLLNEGERPGAALSTPQRQEYDGEAVREAVLDLPFANITPIEWGEFEWLSLARTLSAALNPAQATPSHQGAGE